MCQALQAEKRGSEDAPAEGSGLDEGWRQLDKVGATTFRARTVARMTGSHRVGNRVRGGTVEREWTNERLSTQPQDPSEERA